MLNSSLLPLLSLPCYRADSGYWHVKTTSGSMVFTDELVKNKSMESGLPLIYSIIDLVKQSEGGK